MPEFQLPLVPPKVFRIARFLLWSYSSFIAIFQNPISPDFLLLIFCFVFINFFCGILAISLNAVFAFIGSRINQAFTARTSANFLLLS